MGNTEALPFGKCSTGRSKLQSYEFLKKLQEGKSLMRNKLTKKCVVVIEHTFPTEEQLNEYTKRHKMNYSIAHQFYLNAFDCQVISQANLCSKAFKLAEYFQHQSHTILSEIESRTQDMRHFTGKEFMSILCSCVLVLSYFNKNQILHYTLGPEDIIIDEEGICKVLSSSLSSNLFDFNQKKDFYYAPETLKMFKQQSLVSALTNKSGVFTLGITLLHMIHLKDMKHLYNFHAYTINYQMLNEEIKKIGDGNIQTIVRKMLKPQTYDRISFTELEEMLFEVIAKADQLPKDAYYQSQAYHINKLEESILRLKSQDTAQSSVTNHTKYYAPLLPLESEQEDKPQAAKDHELLSHEDWIVLDEFQQPIGLDCSRTARNMLPNQSMESSGFNQFNSQRVLSDCSNFYNNNNAPAGNYYRASETCRQNKENIANHFPLSAKANTKEMQEYPEYLSEILKEGRYQGYKLGNFRHGFGTFYYNQGGKYCGQWVRNRMQGRGVLYYGSGKIAYQGEWKQDRLDGYGVLYNECIGTLRQQYDYNHLQKINDEWIKYQGYFKDDVKEGQGVLFLSNGEQYRGQFQNDQPHGKGEFRNVRGEVISGFWLMGALNMFQ